MNEDKEYQTNVEANVDENPTEEKQQEEHKNNKKEVKNKLKLENKALKDEIVNLTNELLKNRAELENFKKRTNEENQRLLKFASQDLILNILTPLEYLDKACNFNTENPELKNFLIGFQMIDKQLFQVLIDAGVKEIECKVGDTFDPNYHHAVDTEEQEGIEPGKILKVLSKGYIYKDRIIKPVMVNVSK